MIRFVSLNSARAPPTVAPALPPPKKIETTCFEPTECGLNEFFGPKPIIIDLQAKDRWEAIDELVSKLVASQKIKSEHSDAIAAAVKKRETSMSTGVGFGIALPYACTDLISDVVG